MAVLDIFDFGFFAGFCFFTRYPGLLSIPLMFCMFFSVEIVFDFVTSAFILLHAGDRFEGSPPPWRGGVLVIDLGG